MSDALDALYSAAPADFLATRAELAAAAKADGDAAAAKQIAALRKPTAAASLVNRAALGDPSVAERIADLGDRLRQAHDRLDAAELRELTTERRRLVGELTRAAAAGASTAVRDEVHGTFDAAVADPSVAERLGRLTKAESWSGFGVAPAGPPSLTVVRGGRSGAPSSSASASSASSASRSSTEKAPAVPPAARRKLTRALDRAREAFDAAEAALTEADAAERTIGEDVRALIGELAAGQKRLEELKRDQDAARKAARTARAKRREARSALDRAERNADRG